ncbi:MAG: hypothetical protein EOP19_20340 [Hyphomicrobiales bacterium]|nr:MAG: hypothetical protein EOP19_20340 [Hyphomicrobiales bacterium]
MNAPFTPGLPPRGSTSDFIGRDAQGNVYLLRWHDVAMGWEALGWVGAGRAAMPSLRHPAGQDQGLIVGHIEIAGSGAPAGSEGAAGIGGPRPADRHPEGVRALGPSPAWKEAVARLCQRLEERQRAAAVNAEWLQVPVADVLADATLGVLYADLAELLDAPALHGPFGHLVGAIGLDESHWRIEDNPCAEPGYFSLPMFTTADPFARMEKREVDQ